MKIHEVPDEQFVKNIRNTYLDAIRLGIDLASRDWYIVARNDCQALAELVDLPLRTIVGIVAALSPGLNWEYNVGAAFRLIKGMKCPAYGKNVTKGERIFAGEEPLIVLKGCKVRAFYCNIISSGQDCDCVTIDRWAVKAAMGQDTWNETTPAPTLKHYTRIENAYKSVARDLGILATELQAITWIHVKNQVRHPVDTRQMILIGA